MNSRVIHDWAYICIIVQYVSIITMKEGRKEGHIQKAAINRLKTPKNNHAVHGAHSEQDGGGFKSRFSSAAETEGGQMVNGGGWLVLVVHPNYLNNNQQEGNRGNCKQKIVGDHDDETKVNITNKFDHASASQPAVSIIGERVSE